MRDDFAVFILTHGRADNVITVQTLRDSGYTGKVYLVIDDEDDQEGAYRERYGDQVLQFSKQAIGETFDEGDNFDDRRTITYARNACFELARQVGVRYFMELDDDYTNFEFTFTRRLEWDYIRIRMTLDRVFTALLDYYENTPALAMALCQGGDVLGGGPGLGPIHLRRKAMNSFLCSVDRPFQFRGRMNEDVNTYTVLSRQGAVFFTVLQTKLVQKATQSNAGGITELYKAMGTYTKSFYTVMMCPSSVKISTMGDHRSPHYRIHHKIDWPKTAACILREEWKK